MVVEDVFPAMAGHKHRQHHGAEGVAIFFVLDLKGPHKLQHRINQGAVGRFEHHQGDVGELALPLLPEGPGFAQPQIHVHSHQLAGDRAGVAHGFEAAAVQLAHQHHHRSAAFSWPRRQAELFIGGQPQPFGHLGVVAFDRQEQQHQQGDRHHDHPSPVGELAEQQHPGHHQGHHAAEAIHQGLAPPAKAPLFPPVHHHPGLGEGEAQKHAHRIERDQAGHTAAKHHQQQPCKAAQGQDAVAEHQPIPQGGELAG